MPPPPLPKAAVRAPATEPAGPSEPSADATTGSESAAELPPSSPARVEIGGIGLEAEVTAVGLNTAGAIAMPEDPGNAGWYKGSPAPGSGGNAILVGHVDSHTGPAAFYGLGAVEKGDKITVRREDGRDAVYVVDGMSIWPQDDFPSHRVYGPTQEARLTLLTCTDWDEEKEAYLSNLVVTAHLQADQAGRQGR